MSLSCKMTVLLECASEITNKETGMGREDLASSWKYPMTCGKEIILPNPMLSDIIYI